MVDYYHLFSGPFGYLLYKEDFTIFDTSRLWLSDAIFVLNTI